MSSADGLGLLLETTLAGSAAIALALLLRRPLRARFGAGVAYALWAVVPAAMLAMLLPAASATVPAPVRAAALLLPLPAAPAPQAAPLPWATLAVGLWLSGALAAAFMLLRQQRRFVRSLGRLRPRADGARQAEAVAGLPAAIGLLRPAVVLPRDFDSRYSDAERALMREHERQHIVRGDLQLNAAVALLRCLYWFNPLFHYAARRYRQDQELACDARVIRRHPRARRAYGEAMLKTLLASRPAPLGCHWGHGHPLKERIEMLKQAPVSKTRWFAGAALVGLLAAASGALAWTAQPKRAVAVAPAGHAWLEFEVSVDGSDASRFRVLERYGQDFAISGHDGGSSWSMQGKVAPSGGGLMLLQATLLRNGAVVAKPMLKVRDGVPARITVGSVSGSRDAQVLDGIDMKVTVSSDAARATAPRPEVAPRLASVSTPATQAMPAAQATPAAQPSDRPVAAYRALTPPPYPQGRKVEALVLLDLKVGADGRVEEVKLARSSGDDELDAGTARAARQWRFEPAVQGGRATASWVRVPVQFAAQPPTDTVDASLGAAESGATSGPASAPATLDPIQVRR